MEHLALELAGCVPGLLSAHGGVESEDQASSAGHGRFFRGCHFSEESVEI